MIKKIVSFLIGVVLTVFLCFTFFKSPFKDNLNISIVETFLESEVYVISAEYPQFNLVDDNFNKEIEKCVLERIDSFKENATSNWSARGRHILRHFILKLCGSLFKLTRIILAL